MRLTPVSPKTRLRLTDARARWHEPPPPDGLLKPAVSQQVERIGDLQRTLYADGRFALLVILQGRDASGKDGTIRKVFADVNPQGCEVTSFKVPSDLERRHDFLWRVHARIPPRGMIGIFNRSQYEDVLVPSVHGQLTAREATVRLGEINDFERMLAGAGVAILKFFLHTSREEQRKNLQERLTDPTKNWKFNAGDLDDRARWADYTRAYRMVLSKSSTAWAPWYVVPADDNDVRNWLIAETVADTLAGLGLRYPRATKETLALRIR
jgi:PPK2 family polyphosphate:nucleotide phosphotransferase